MARIAEVGRERTLADAIGLELGPFLATGEGPVRWCGPIVDGGLAAFLGRPESFKSMAVVQFGLAAAAGGSWLGIELGEPRPFVYLAAEKSAATIRDRLARMTERIRPVAPVRIVHRAGVTFGDRASWDRVVELVTEYGPRTFVAGDTIASLAGPGFDENSGRDMATVLAALRRLGDVGATVAAVHHPAKHGEGTGGIRLRGHSSLWGEVDGTVEFTRPDRAVEAGMVRIEPKDGDLRLIAFRWDRETFLLEPEAGLLAVTPSTIAEVVDALYAGQPLSADRIRAEFPGHGRSAFLDRLRDTVTAGLVARIGGGRTSGYVPVPRIGRAGRIPDEPV
ncbi:MAG: AAA family ATPase [Chloroflexota bacterium]